MNFGKLSIIFGAMGAGILLAPGGAAACAVCGLDDVSFLWSAFFMMGMPVAIVGAVGGVVLYSAHKNNPQRRPRGLQRLFRPRQEKPF